MLFWKDVWQAFEGGSGLPESFLLRVLYNLDIRKMNKSLTLNCLGRGRSLHQPTQEETSLLFSNACVMLEQESGVHPWNNLEVNSFWVLNYSQGTLLNALCVCSNNSTTPALEQIWGKKRLNNWSVNHTPGRWYSNTNIQVLDFSFFKFLFFMI